MCSYVQSVVLLMMLLCAYSQDQKVPTKELPEGAECSVDERNGTCVSLYKCPSAANYYLYSEGGLHEALSNLSRPQLCASRPSGEFVVCCTDCSLDQNEKLAGGVGASRTAPRCFPAPLCYPAHAIVFLFSAAMLRVASAPCRMCVCVHNVARTHARRQQAWKKCLEYWRELPYPCRGKSSYELTQTWDEQRKCDRFLKKSFVHYGIGGYAAKKDQFPHMALLGYGASREEAQWLCGGSVISERYILTAAHCASTPSLGSVSLVALGVLTRDDVTDYWRVYSVRAVITHPMYRAPHKYHDIALLHTNTEINFGKALLPACLYTGGSNTEWAVAPGWGCLGHKGELAEHLMVMELSQFEESSCAAIFPPHRLLKGGYNVSTQMCYGRTDKVVDTCEGDSGGPLQVSWSECQYFVVGVTSYGKDCGIPGNAGMYTRVAHYVPWIESVVWPED